MTDTRQTALICGISGQDGAYLAKFLLDRGYRVTGTSRDAGKADFSNLVHLGIRDKVEIVSLPLTEPQSVRQTVSSISPEEIYNLAGQSSVARSFKNPAETIESTVLGTLNLLESARSLNSEVRLFNAASGECFGDTGGTPADEQTPFRPRSPYAAAKASSFWEVATYRETYGLYACSGILFNHESPLRPERFVTQKIVHAACRIANGSRERLELGNIYIQRDWGWAPEYVEAMWKMLQQQSPDDYVIATGVTVQLQDFLALAFEAVGLDWHDHVDINEAYIRPTDLAASRADPSKAASKLGWKARIQINEIVQLMMDSAMRHLARE